MSAQIYKFCYICLIVIFTKTVVAIYILITFRTMQNKISIGIIARRIPFSDVYDKTGHPCQDDFRTFADIIGVLPKKREDMIEKSYNERHQRFLRKDI